MATSVPGEKQDSAQIVCSKPQDEQSYFPGGIGLQTPVRANLSSGEAAPSCVTFSSKRPSHTALSCEESSHISEETFREK